MAIISLFILITVTVLAEVSSEIESKQLLINQKSTADTTGIKWKFGMPEQWENTGSDVNVAPSLNRDTPETGHESVALINKVDSVKYKFIFERIIKDVIKAKQALALQTSSDKYRITTLQETKKPLSSKRDDQIIFESGLNSNREAKNHATPFPNNSNGMKQSLKTTRVYPFQVAVIISKPKIPRRNSVIFVPLLVDMTVLDAFVYATRIYMDKMAVKTEDVPFNVVLDWDNELQCYIVIKAVGLENKRRQAWVFTVRDARHVAIYKDRCLPGDNVILRPRSSVQLTYQHIKRLLY
ncbi:uncharacterized protein LOC132726875 [Ruditapes philippinarum]|uniref:uncharacterized protein LOC132726875 n=1 Tax=Ruditapes philippinarum TaxID=129788 RepID=UPI00295B087C|nr:uncharacterized protein LOC132726875 [Ruditapes philippinarum]